jgi:hypothetical protein
VRWSVDLEGNLINFDLRTLRNDILFRLRTGHALYTTEECKAFIVEIIRLATAWQEEELPQLMYLSELHAKVLPGHQPHFRWPVTYVEQVPFSLPPDAVHDSATYRITKVVEELNRSLVRAIDRVWNDRRERLLLAAAMLADLEPLMQKDH